MTGVVQKLAEKPKTLIDTILELKPQIQAALPKHISADRIARIAITVIRTNPKLAACRSDSFLGSLMVASQLGLEPNTKLGYCYLIPYGNECQFQLGYQGLLDLARRCGLYSVIYAEKVYAGDEFKVELGFNKNLKHIPAEGPRVGEPIAYYAVYKLKDGTGDFSVMWREEIEAHAKKYSKSYMSGPWKTNFNSMAAKTVIIQVLKYAPKSIEIAEAVTRDSAAITVDMKKLKEGSLIIEDSYEVEKEQPIEEVKDLPGADLLM